MFERATLAEQKGLAGKALTTLLQFHWSAFGDRGVALELRLMVHTGRSREARDWVTPDDRTRLGPNAYHWLRILAFAAGGDYELAQTECAALGGERLPYRETIGLLVGQVVLEERPGDGPLAYLLRRGLGWRGTLERLPQAARRLTQQAHVNVLQGLLALEEGRVSQAREFFREALNLWKDEATALRGGGLDFTGRPVAQGCLELLE